MRWLLIFCAWGLISCNKTYRLENRKLDVARAIDNVSDSIYFSDICSLSCIGDTLFFIDQNKARIYVLCDNFNGCKFWGEAGHAGNEFNYLAGVHPCDDRVYAFDGGRQVIFIYDMEGNLLCQYQLRDDAMFFSSGLRCIIKGNQLIGGGYTVDNGCLTINMADHQVIKWGNVFEFKLKKQAMFRNSRHLFQLNNTYFAVSDNLPIIEVYDEKYDLISTYNYSNIDVVDSRLKKLAQVKEEEKSYSILCSDAYLYRQSLYLLIADFDDGGYNVNKLIEMKLDGDQIIPNKVFNLPGKIYSSFCINEKGVFAYNVSDSRLEFLNM